MEKFDIVIIGGGPAGLKAAEVLAKEGREVIVLEKNAVIGPKTCAGGLTSKDFELGIPNSLPDRVFYSIKIHSSDKTFTINRKNKPLVATVDRKKLGQWMLSQAQKSGAKVRTKARVVKIENNSVFLEKDQEIRFNYLIGADGSLSLLRRWLNIPTKKFLITLQYIIPYHFENLEVFFNKKLFGLGYAWIFPHKEFTVVGCGNISTHRNIGKLRENFEFWFKEKKINLGKDKLDSFPVNYDYRGFDFGNKFLIGDAAGLASGLTGKGIYSALASGEEVARKILNPSYSCSKIKQILRAKALEEKLGRFLHFLVLKNETLTKIIFKKIF